MCTILTHEMHPIATSREEQSRQSHTHAHCAHLTSTTTTVMATICKKWFSHARHRLKRDHLILLCVCMMCVFVVAVNVFNFTFEWHHMFGIVVHVLWLASHQVSSMQCLGVRSHISTCSISGILRLNSINRPRSKLKLNKCNCNFSVSPRTHKTL